MRAKHGALDVSVSSLVVAALKRGGAREIASESCHVLGEFYVITVRDRRYVTVKSERNYQGYLHILDADSPDSSRKC